MLTFGEGTISLTVRDDGRGFDMKDVAKLDPSHFGLQGMRGRVRRLDGQFHLESVPGQGTTIRATFPHSDKQVQHPQSIP